MYRFLLILQFLFIQLFQNYQDPIFDSYIPLICALKFKAVIPQHLQKVQALPLINLLIIPIAKLIQL